tara:strand:- start:917 stop:1129 length:213 start_codon:yes stop_codon:yes gene_type:complete
MCTGGGAPQPPEPLPPPAQPAVKASPAVREARASERRRVRAMAGRQSTIKTGALGIAEQADRQMKRLLGG